MLLTKPHATSFSESLQLSKRRIEVLNTGSRFRGYFQHVNLKTSRSSTIYA